MTALAQTPDCVRAYDVLAPHYDEFTAGYAHSAWIEAIETRAKALGLKGRRALDVGCGTGKSTRPLRDRGYEVMGCDISPEMIRIARESLPACADAFFVADMRALPNLGQFDLVVCLDDAINYVDSVVELRATFAGVARVLSPSGVFAFDLNSLRTYRSAFAQSIVRESAGTFFAWRGEGSDDIAAGEATSARLEIFSKRTDGLWERCSSRHRQRHFPPDTVRAELAAAGLECCAIAGQLPGAFLETRADEERHIKLVYFARHVPCGGARP